MREALQQLDSGARLQLEPRATRRVDDLALVSNTATLTEATLFKSVETRSRGPIVGRIPCPHG
jgi:hypothetical protein